MKIYKLSKEVEIGSEFALCNIHLFFKHKAGIENSTTYALCRVIYILTSLAVQVIGFDKLIEE